MGANMARRLLRGGHEVVVFDRSPQARAAETASLQGLAAALDPPRAA